MTRHPYQTIVLAGGRGTRLSPMTQGLPKPLVPLAGEPVLHGLFRLLLAHNITEVTLALGHGASDIIAACGDRFGALSISYQTEETPRGTAGAVALAAEHDTRPVLVLSGDAVLEADLSALFAFHEARGAAVTMLLARRSAPAEYGVVVCERDGRVSAFLEKPSAEQTYTDTVNTGIYVLSRAALDRIPHGRTFDFSRDLFPALLAEGLPIYGYKSNDYWCDIGDFASYRAANFREAGGENIYGKHCRVAETAHLSGCILHDGVTIGAHTSAEQAILCRGVTVGAHVTIGCGAVIGADCVLADGVRIAEGVHIARGTHLTAGSRILTNSTDTEETVVSFASNGITLTGAAPEGRFYAVACALSATADAVLLLAEHTADAARVSLLAAALVAAGVDVTKTDAANTAVAAELARLYHLPLTILYRDTADGCVLQLSDAHGLFPHRLFARKLEAAWRAPHRREGRGDIHAAQGAMHLYRGRLAGACGNVSGLTLHVTGDSFATTPLRAALAAHGALFDEAAAVTLTLSADGMGLVAREDGHVYDFWHLVAICLTRCAPNSEVALPHTAPFALSALCERAGVRERRFAQVPCDNKEETLRAVADSTPWTTDGSFLAVRLATLLAESGASLALLAESLPPFAWRHIRYNENLPEAAIFADFGLPAGDGVVRFPAGGGMVRLMGHTGGGFSLYSEAETAQVAESLGRAAEAELFATLAHKEADGGEY